MSFQKSNQVCAVVVVYNGWAVIEKTICSIYDQVGQVLVVDNNSDQKTLNILKNIENRFSKLMVLYNEHNYGIAKAFNQGIEYALHNNYLFVLLLDQDSQASFGMVERMLSYYQKNEFNQMITLCPVVLYDSKEEISSNNDHLITDKWRNKKSTISSGHLFSTQIVLDVGFLDESIFIDLVDFDFCLRLRIKGYSIIQCNEAYLLHTLGLHRVYNLYFKKYKVYLHSNVRLYYKTRNHLYIVKKYILRFPLFCLIKTKTYFINTITDVVCQPNKIKNIYYILKGLRDGIRGRMGPVR